MSKTTFRLVGAAQGFNWLPVFVALEKGYFDQAGLAVELQKLGGVSKATQALLDEEAELAITPPEGAIADFVNGGDLRIVASNSNRLPMSLVARPGIESMEQMKGSKIGTSSLTEGTAIYTQIMLAEHGLHYPGDYDFELAGIHITRWEALQKGEIDAAPQPAPWNFMAQNAGYNLIGEIPDYIPEVVFAGIIGNKSWLDANPQVIEPFLSALDKGYAYANDPANEAECAKIFQSITTKDDAQLAHRGYVYMRDLGMWPAHMEVTATALATSIDLMIRAGLLEEDKREMAKGVFEPSYLKRALA
ncbi:ABC transporter substrate-binding protein [Aurantiacibacter flavus]|uniref:ABC transporter substrate-binding protein n=1 Tax=Aurantiacibacter flavus TaxID=3145232 RepID=A0ABV0D028_9SPHN